MKNRKKLNKKGFISSSIIITFVVLFLLLMIALLEKYINTRRNVQKSAEDIREDLNAKVKGKDGLLLSAVISKKYDALIALYERDQHPDCHKNSGEDGEYCINLHRNENYEVYKFSKDYMDYNSPVFFYYQTATHNNVIFADRCWKIIRTTETGGVKLLYVGLPDENGTCKTVTNKDGIGKIKYNEYIDHVPLKEYVGYTYKISNTTVEQNSKLKAQIDNFLISVIKPVSYFVEDTHWCNDRSEPMIGDGTVTSYGPKRRLGNIVESVKKMYANTETVIYKDYTDTTSYFSQLADQEPVEIEWNPSTNTPVLYGDTTICPSKWAKVASGPSVGNYVCFKDLVSQTATQASINTPETMYCSQQADRYTVSHTINYVQGNELLEDVGISGATITADEVYMIYDNSRDPKAGYNYLIDGYNGFWTMSPVDFDGTSASVYSVSDYGYLVSSDVQSEIGVRPAISLKYNTYVYETVNGIRSDGSAEKPYHVITDLKKYIPISINDDLFYANSDNGYESGIRVDFDEDGLKSLVLDGEFSQQYITNNTNLNLFVNTPTGSSSQPFRMTIKKLDGSISGNDLKLYIKINDAKIESVDLPTDGFSEVVFTGIPKAIYIKPNSSNPQKFSNYKIDIELTRDNAIYERYDDGWYKIDGNNYIPIYNLKTDIAPAGETEWDMPTDFRSGYTFKGYCSRRGGGASYLVVYPTGEIKAGMNTEFSYTGSLYAWWDKDYVAPEENP